MSYKITITIETGNAAFEEDEGAELSRIMKDMAPRFANMFPPDLDGTSIRDSNGNPVGKVTVEPA
jgi:hypothetical protein